MVLDPLALISISCVYLSQRSVKHPLWLDEGQRSGEVHSSVTRVMALGEHCTVNGYVV